MDRLYLNCTSCGMSARFNASVPGVAIPNAMRKQHKTGTPDPKCAGDELLLVLGSEPAPESETTLLRLPWLPATEMLRLLDAARDGGVEIERLSKIHRVARNAVRDEVKRG